MAIAADDIQRQLRRLHIFRTLGDDDIHAIAELCDSYEYEPGQVVFDLGDEPWGFYVICQGAVTLSALADPQADSATVIARLGRDDYFGEVALLEAATFHTERATAIQPTILLAVSKKDFLQVLADYPDVLTGLKLVKATRDLIVRRRFHRWLAENEVVYLISLTHWAWLLRKSIVPALVGIVALIGVGLLYTLQLFWLPALIAVGVVLSIWGLVLYIDWRDDAYIVTNLRIISDERLALIYTTRAEAPLLTVRALQVSQQPFEKVFGYGDVVIQTFTGSVTFTDVPNPYAIVELISEQLERAQAHKRRTDEETLQREIRVGIGWESPPPARGPAPEPLEPRPVQPARGNFLEYLRPRFRIQEGGTITWRKHPLKLAQRVGPALLGLALLAALTFLRMYPIVPRLEFLTAWSLEVWTGLVFVAGLGFIGWAWYQFEDWNNDTYSVTPNMVIDHERKPLLGNVQQRTASIDSVLNVTYERPGLLANLLNYGTVTIQTGGATGELTFDWVVNPLDIQQEIFRRMEQRQRYKDESDAARRRSEMIYWLRAYTAVTKPDKPSETQ